MHALAGRLIELSNWRAALLITLVYALFLSQVMAPQGAMMAASAGPWGAPDGHFYYSVDELYAAINSWPAAARDSYTRFRMGLDPLWALVYSSWLVILTGIGLRRGTRPQSHWRLLVLFPLLPMLADLGENLCGIVLVSALPERLDILARLTAVITAFKWTTLAAAHAVMIASLGHAAVRGNRAM